MLSRLELEDESGNHGLGYEEKLLVLEDYRNFLEALWDYEGAGRGDHSEMPVHPDYDEIASIESDPTYQDYFTDRISRAMETFLCLGMYYHKPTQFLLYFGHALKAAMFMQYMTAGISVFHGWGWNWLY